MAELYYVCEECGCVVSASEPPGACGDCDAAEGSLRPYRRLQRAVEGRTEAVWVDESWRRDG